MKTQVPKIKVINNKLEIDGDFKFESSPVILTEDSIPIKQITFNHCLEVPQVDAVFNCMDKICEMLGEKLKQDYIKHLEVANNSWWKSENNDSINNLIKQENDNLIEIQFLDNKPYVVGEFKFKKDDITPSHPTSFRKWKPIKFGFPVLIDLPLHGNADSSEIYEVIGESLKNDFIKFLNENKPE